MRSQYNTPLTPVTYRLDEGHLPQDGSRACREAKAVHAASPWNAVAVDITAVATRTRLRRPRTLHTWAVKLWVYTARGDDGMNALADAIARQAAPCEEFTITSDTLDRWDIINRALEISRRRCPSNQ
jgi:hypothetical protein